STSCPPPLRTWTLPTASRLGGPPEVFLRRDHEASLPGHQHARPGQGVLLGVAVVAIEIAVPLARFERWTSETHRATMPFCRRSGLQSGPPLRGGCMPDPIRETKRASGPRDS